MCLKSGGELAPPHCDASELLLRNVSPVCFADDGHPSSQAFLPRRRTDHHPGDEGCLSVDRGSQASPASSHALFTSEKPRGFAASSAGVWAVSIGEVVAQRLTAWGDPVPASPQSDTPANPAHAVIDFGGVSESGQRKQARTLKARALERGRLHPL